MIWTAIALFVTTAATASSAMFPPSTADAPPGPGIPLTLAEDRARRVSNLRYDLKLTIPQSPSDRLRGTIIVSGPLLVGRPVPRDRSRAVTGSVRVRGSGLRRLLLLALAATTHEQDADDADQNR